MIANSIFSKVVIEWVLVTCVIPIALPVLVNMIFWAVPASHVPSAQREWYFPFKDGQLFWVVVGLSASAIYELRPALPYHDVMEYTLWGILALSCVFGAIDAIWPVDPNDAQVNWLRRSGLMTHSMLLLGLVGALFALIHFA
jgi:hypothetical protein